MFWPINIHEYQCKNLYRNQPESPTQLSGSKWEGSGGGGGRAQVSSPHLPLPTPLGPKVCLGVWGADTAHRTPVLDLIRDTRTPRVHHVHHVHHVWPTNTPTRSPSISRHTNKREGVWLLRPPSCDQLQWPSPKQRRCQPPQRGWV